MGFLPIFRHAFSPGSLRCIIAIKVFQGKNLLKLCTLGYLFGHGFDVVTYEDWIRLQENGKKMTFLYLTHIKR